MEVAITDGAGRVDVLRVAALVTVCSLHPSTSTAMRITKTSGRSGRRATSTPSLSISTQSPRTPTTTQTSYSRRGRWSGRRVGGTLMISVSAVVAQPATRLATRLVTRLAGILAGVITVDITVAILIIAMDIIAMAIIVTLGAAPDVTAAGSTGGIIPR